MRNRRPWIAASVLALSLVPAFVASAAINDTTPISATPAGVLADGPSGPGVAINADARYVVFESAADNLSNVDNDSVVNVYVHDRETKTTELVSRASGQGGAGADASSSNPAISPGGRVVAFESRATNLSDADDDTVSDIFLRDLTTDTTTLASRAPDGSPADGDSGDPALSGTRVVAFESVATNLSDVDDDSVSDIFTYSWEAGTTTLVSRFPGGSGGDGPSFDPSISRDGRRFAFASQADNLSALDDNSFTNVFYAEPRFFQMKDVSRTTTSGSVSDPADGDSFDPVISDGGSHIAFVSNAANLTEESVRTPSIADVFVREISANKTSLASRATGAGGAPGFADSGSPSISGDGRLVAYSSAAGNLSAEDGAGMDVFVRDAAYDTTTLLSRGSGASGPTGAGDSGAPALSRYGGLLAFVSDVDELTVPENDVVGPTVFARRLSWPAPPVTGPDLGDNTHCHGLPGCGEDGHMDGHGDAHAADAHGHAADGHGHGPGGHFLLRVGGAVADRLFGTPLHDKFCGGGGNDVISLGGGPDVGYGGDCGPVEPPTVTKSGWWRTLPSLWRHAGDIDAAPKSGAGVNDNDRLSGGKGDDALFGGPGSDRVVGGSGADYLSGGSGHDRLVGGPGRNRIEAGGGSDSINSANGVREMVDCGFGDDSVTADRRDVLTGCERVKRVRRKSQKELIELLPECPGGGHECHNGSDTVVLSKARRAG